MTRMRMMGTEKKRGTLRKIAESGVLLGLGLVLSMIKITLNPNGGSITVVSMLPIVILACKYGPMWGMLCGMVHGIIQVIEGGGFAPPVQTVGGYITVFLLDYLLAWAAVGLIAGLLRSCTKKVQVAIALGSFFGIMGRFLCSFVSGIVIWSAYAPEGQSVVVYSFVANAMLMIPEMVITAIVGYGIFRVPVMQKQLTDAASSQAG